MKVATLLSLTVDLEDDGRTHVRDSNGQHWILDPGDEFNYSFAVPKSSTSNFLPPAVLIEHKTGECPCGGTWGVCEYHK